MLRYFKQFILTTLFAVFASQATALFIQADWWDPSDPRVGTNRYAYSHNDPINLADPGGNAPDYGYGTENSYYTGVQEPSTSYYGSSHGSQVSHYDHVYIGNETGNVYRDGNGLQSQSNSIAIARTNAALEDLAKINHGLAALAGLSSGELTVNQAMNMANSGTVNGGMPTAGPLPRPGRLSPNPSGGSGRRDIDPLTTANATDLANWLGFNKVRQGSSPVKVDRGQAVFMNRGRYISPDIDSHNGGVWKMFDRRGNRTGTYNFDLTERLGD